MKIELYSDNIEKAITLQRKQVLDRIVSEIFDSEFGQVYQQSDINKILFYYKGHPDLDAFYILVKLNFTESNDVMENIQGRMRRIESNLAFMSMSRFGMFGDTKSVFNFWYYLPEEDRLVF